MKTIRVQFDKVACCPTCDADHGTMEAFRWARTHALKTGHVPTVTVIYDIHPNMKHKDNFKFRDAP